MRDTIRGVLKFLIIMLLNLCIAGFVALFAARNTDVPVLSRIGSRSNERQANTDYDLLARIISAESRSEPYAGQVAVGAVILNRVQHPSFPDSIAGVIYQPGAFSALDDGQFDETVAESAFRAATDAMNGSDPSGGAIYYYNPKRSSNEWMRSRQVIATIGDHAFCK